MDDMMQRTYETRLAAEADADAALEAYAALYGCAARTLFARLQAGGTVRDLKRAFLVRFGLTARQFNALAVEVRGTIAASVAQRVRRLHHLERKIHRAQQVLRTLRRGTNEYHQKRRRLGSLAQRLVHLRADHARGRVRLCFGSRRRFRAQFALAENGYASHDAWCRDWRAARANQFFVLGSKDETSGCQGCVATVAPDGTIALRLRLPNAHATPALGRHLVLRGLRFAYGHDAVVAAIGRNLSRTAADGEAISWRFLRARRGWRVCATVSVPAGPPRNVAHTGVVAIDLNADHLAVADLDRCGNPVGAFRVPCLTRGKTHHQARAILGDAVSQVVTYACLRQKPVVVERLDFEAKKAEVERTGAGYSRMLSAFAYATVQALLHARCYDAGIALHRVHPAYTSMIGACKFADRYGLTRHQAAACAIGRRGMHLAERPNRRPGAHVTVPLPARTRGTHVWAFWRGVARRAAAHQARGRPGVRVRSSPAPIPGSRRDTARRVTSSSAAGGTPAREASATLFG
jgi:IS605 OrfB family transposase